ncbi:hypothetical protein RBH26_20920 [Natronolimnohabitans sp. A-GB9]|uniref:hypothetical protein n=1 Tax=Natronolimnohabitans sp. A-GB9 TaxID=3069757 RepID=UPI0027B3A39C|nr:hypothetical protein [Natronolimnohabitans sp. A-GB9]MDQ2052908.1 hypothetical protein [Natronolimnohabitans sp. A-GB9]
MDTHDLCSRGIKIEVPRSHEKNSFQTPIPPMTLDHPPAERPILSKVETGLKQAVENDPDLDWMEEGTRIRRQKYTEQAVDHFTQHDEEPVLTSSWYKFGKTYPAAPSGANVGNGQFPSPHIRESEIFDASPAEIEHFFAHEADEPRLDAQHWYMPTLEFLEKFYTIHAPEKYKELYLQNIELRRVFEDTTHEISSLRESQSGSGTSLSDFGSSRSVDYYKRAGRTAARLHMELATIPELEEALEPVREFTDLLEDVLMELAKIEQSNLKARHRTAIDSLETFYNDQAWEYPAAIIMRDTAEGPNSDWVVNQAEQKLDTLREEYTTDLEDQRRLCAEAGLLPKAHDYPSHDDEVASAISGMMKSVDQMDE